MPWCSLRISSLFLIISLKQIKIQQVFTTQSEPVLYGICFMMTDDYDSTAYCMYVQKDTTTVLTTTVDLI